MIAVAVLATLPPAAVATSGPEPPMNVVFILADDLGWSDTTLYGTTELYRTPNVMRLASRGMTFNRAYSNSPLCSPTRASLMTGQTPARHGSTRPQHHLPASRVKASPGYKAAAGEKAIGVNTATRLDTAYPTLGKLMRAAGYSTGHFGKWHLGREPYSPLEHGFDVDVPHHAGPGPAGSFVAPWTYPDFKANYPGEHIEDRMAEEAVTWMESVAGERPFFMNYWQFSVHAPFDAKQELIDEYRELIDPESPQRCSTYAAMVHSLDDAVGSLLDAVDRAGIAERTVIVFTSDNGGNTYSRVDAEYPTSNAPLRGGKATMYEGGIRVPCIVIWPGVTEPGSRSDEVIQTSDFFPTLLNGLGIDVPADHPIDGADITPALRGDVLSREAIFTYFPYDPPIPDWLPPSMAVHSGDWKLIRLFHQGEEGEHAYRLFNIADDIGEQRDLSSAHPDIVQRLDGMMEAHLIATDAVRPRPNPEFDPSAYKPENIGLPERLWKSPRNRKEFAAGRIRGPLYEQRGIWGNHMATLRLAGEELHIDCTGKDPQLLFSHIPEARGPYTLEITAQSSRKGPGTVFWCNSERPSFTGGWSTDFTLKHAEDRWQNYSVELPALDPVLTHLRLDPGNAPGRVRIASVVLKDGADQVVKSWLRVGRTETISPATVD